MLNAIEQVNKDEVIQNYYSHFFVKLKKVTFAKSPGRGGGRGAVSYMGSYIGDTVQISEHFEIEQ